MWHVLKAKRWKTRSLSRILAPLICQLWDLELVNNLSVPVPLSVRYTLMFTVCMFGFIELKHIKCPAVPWTYQCSVFVTMAHAHLLSIPGHLHFLAISHQIITHVRNETTLSWLYSLPTKALGIQIFTQRSEWMQGDRSGGGFTFSKEMCRMYSKDGRRVKGWGLGRKKTGLKPPEGRGHVHKSLSLELEDSSLQVNRYMQNEGGNGGLHKIISKIEIK